MARDYRELRAVVQDHTHTRKSRVVDQQGVSRRLRRIGVRTRSWFLVVKDAGVRGGPWAIE